MAILTQRLSGMGLLFLAVVLFGQNRATTTVGHRFGRTTRERDSVVDERRG
jgi:hypothetical protein